MKPTLSDADLIREELRARYERNDSSTRRMLPRCTADVHFALAALNTRRPNARSELLHKLENLIDNMNNERSERCKKQNIAARDDLEIYEATSDSSSEYSTNDFSFELEDAVLNSSTGTKNTETSGRNEKGTPRKLFDQEEKEHPLADVEKLYTPMNPSKNLHIVQKVPHNSSSPVTKSHTQVGDSNSNDDTASKIKGLSLSDENIKGITERQGKEAVASSRGLLGNNEPSSNEGIRDMKILIHQESFENANSLSKCEIYLKRKLEAFSKSNSLSSLDQSNSQIPKLCAISAASRVKRCKVLKMHPTVSNLKAKSHKLPIQDRKSFGSRLENVQVIIDTALSQVKVLKDEVRPASSVEEDYYDWKDVLVTEFLPYKSAFESNWFGKIKKSLQNHRTRERVTPAFGVAFEGLHRPQAWEKDWYTSWTTKTDQLNTKSEDISIGIMISSSTSITSADIYSETRKTPKYHEQFDAVTSILEDESVSIICNSTTIDKENRNENTWIGNIHVTKLKLGERLSRIHPDYTSSLYQSKWKRKFFPDKAKE